ncbi:MAG: methyltransferase domain-containing protein [Deltaproteobacteria bacterium]|nr:methyltransferase domain-containing protein [Deltaproteobacteria bacterium]
MDTITYLKTFIRDKNVASITPTSPFGVRKVCREINFASSDLIVEYGPGTGVFTNYLLKYMRNDSRLILIERNKYFSSILERNIRDPRVIFVNDSAENVLETLRSCQESEADCIISGIPFLLLSEDMKNRILYNTHRALKDKGKFLVYQTCFQADHHFKFYLDRYFPRVNTKFEVRNIPPLRIYEAIK